MIVSGMSGNEIFCLAQKGYTPGELVVGNSVCSLGVIGGVGAWGRGIAGGELVNVTELISQGRHDAITRMEKEADKSGAAGVTSVTSELRTLAGYMEFLAQGSAVSGDRHGDRTFSTSASGMEMYCQLDAGYAPVRFAMGNVAYALGIGRGLVGSVRTMARGEVREFSKMYNDIRHLALDRLRQEAKAGGANAVVDVQVRLQPFGPAATELLMTGTASHHPKLGQPGSPDDVVTSELTGEELWNLAKLGYRPVQLVMATSVYSLGVVGGLGAMFRGMQRGEIPELTKLIYEARENCVDLMRQEGERFGAERVIGNRLSIRELSPGLIEVMALGTSVKRAEDMQPATAALIPQAIIVERAALDDPLSRMDTNVAVAARTRAMAAGQEAQRLGGCAGAIIAIVSIGFFVCFGLVVSLLEGG